MFVPITDDRLANIHMNANARMDQLIQKNNMLEAWLSGKF